MTEIMYKCDTCGKWSHALRNPKRHQRFVREEPLDLSTVIEERPSSYGYEGYNDDGGWMVWCGPFTTYHAVPKEDDA